jgi:hypothetical protein
MRSPTGRIVNDLQRHPSSTDSSRLEPTAAADASQCLLTAGSIMVIFSTRQAPYFATT